MTRFEETVRKIAQNPWKCAMFGRLPQLLYKDAAFNMNDLFGAAGAPRSGAQDIAKSIASGVGQAAVLGGTAYGLNRLLNNEQTSSRNSALGRLQAEQVHRSKQLEQLSPHHEATFNALRDDPILAKADPSLIQSSFETMKRFAPNVASDPHASRAFLQEVALYGKGPSYATLKTLADTERAIQQAQGY